MHIVRLVSCVLSTGRPAYYVLIECGTLVERTKTTTGNHKEICWNEKFAFEFPSFEWENLTHLKFKVMAEEYLFEGGFVGETIIYLQGFIKEGNDNGFLEVRPTPYNVVLEDDTYQGEIKIGLKFFPNKEKYTVTTRTYVEEEQETRQSICRTIMNLVRIPWGRFLFFCSRNCEDKQKQV